MTADPAGSPDPISDEAITRLIKAFYEAHGVESWESSAEYRYGAEHHWMREAFAEIAPLLVSADSSAQAEPTHYGEAPDGMGWTKHRGLIGECSAPDCADDPDALNARLIAALDASESVVEGLRAELAETTRFKDVLHGIVRTVARIVHRSPNDDGGYLYADVPAMVERELAALRAAGGQEKPVCPLTEAGIEHRPHHYLTPVPWDCPGLPAAPVGGQEKPNDATPQLANCTTCGATDAECRTMMGQTGAVRSCCARCKMTDTHPAAPVGGQAEPSNDPAAPWHALFSAIAGHCTHFVPPEVADACDTCMRATDDALAALIRRGFVPAAAVSGEHRNQDGKTHQGPADNCRECAYEDGAYL